MHANTIEADTLSVERTATHIYLSGFEGPDLKAVSSNGFQVLPVITCLTGQRDFPTSEHDTILRKELLFGDEVVAKKILTVKTSCCFHPTAAMRVDFVEMKARPSN
jgi:hypothetical protein